MLQTYARSYVPQDFKPLSWGDIEVHFQELSERVLATKGELERWIVDVNELLAVVGEESAQRHIRKDCSTEDAEAKQAYMEWIEQVAPKLQPAVFELQKKLVAHPACDELDKEEFGCYLRSVRNSVELFREENVPLNTQESKLQTEYGAIIGAQTVEFDGQERTLPQMKKYLESVDRDVREQAFRVSEARRSEDYAKLEDVFDKLYAIRKDKAANAGFDNYRALRWREFERFDYTPEDCLTFIDSIEKVCVPRMKALQADRRQKLGVEPLRPWDTAVDPHGDEPLVPFENSKDLIEQSKETFRHVDPLFAEYFDHMAEQSLLDLDSRKGKAPGGYQATLQERRLPFIFMNAAGTQRDVDTLLHEGGHAFHAIEQRDLRLTGNRGAPMEFCEVASMSMELMAGEHIHKTFYDEAQARRARLKHLEGVIEFFPWMATIDGFQHWLYSHPEHTREERAEEWLKIRDRFEGDVDWSGFEDGRRYRWMQQIHLFGYPFYYVEYGIAQIGALQIWRNYLEDPKQAIKDYRHALSLGSTRTLPELFEAANIKFDFSQDMLESLMQLVESKLAEFKSA